VIHTWQTCGWKGHLAAPLRSISNACGLVTS
jgi:hypothetical protein